MKNEKGAIKRVYNEGHGTTKQILGLRIERDRMAGILKLIQDRYIKKVQDRFNMTYTKPMKIIKYLHSLSIYL